jgi:hypothetical protein
MDDNKELKDNLLKTANEATSNLIYTVVFDLCSEFISNGVTDEAKVLEIASSVVQKYVEGGIKVRKKPAARPRVAKTPAKDKPVDALTAASRKMDNVSNKITWITHPDDDSYSYSTNIKLANGYPVKLNETGKIVMVATDDDAVPLTVKDAKVARSYGLDVDYSNISSK